MEKHDDDVTTVNNQPMFTPYNESNVQITLNEVQTILTTYNVFETIHDVDIYKRAFVHRSYCNRKFEQPVSIAPCPYNGIPVQPESNERLEFLGDGILECVTKLYLYTRFPSENEGFMTEKKIALVKNESIGVLAIHIGLSKWYILSKQSEAKHVRSNVKKIGCLFEAFIGALFEDLGFYAAQTFIISVFERHVNWKQLLNADDNYKNILQVKIQKHFKTTPEYAELHHDGAYRMGVFLCIGHSKNWKPADALPLHRFGSFDNIQTHVNACKRVIVLLGEGTHKNKKKAEQLACEQALSRL
jgi:dsRNA-specific ribonuclease